MAVRVETLAVAGFDSCCSGAASGGGTLVAENKSCSVQGGQYLAGTSPVAGAGPQCSEVTSLHGPG